MRAFLGLAAIIALLLPASGLAAGASKPPTHAQIQRAVSSAERSSKLWATVNVCHARKFGIRGQMPALGFAASMSMKIQVEYWNSAKKRFQPLHGVTKTISLGTIKTDLHQAGFTWAFTPPAILSGLVTFRWKLGNNMIGHTTRLTARGVKGVDGGDPKGTSKASCRLRR